ncbi:MAG: NAD-dependent epimerase/dehydratase family protein [Methylovulum sp.]|nr:NAD-dependent epimerase/dehydratase family protein [Methylovulum sp.]MCF7997781.1 NAD-dependent epimerase/dehydratase family protein [Methylovulum sp.]MCF8494740.1 NAD-dependent epimerase/dehydratase family protein [Rickettsiaceae bacterium]
MKVLITGGNGNISWHCVNNAILAGMDVTVVKRSQGSLLRRKLPNNVKIINADVRNISSFRSALYKIHFDVVIDFLCYTPEQAETVIWLFKDIVKQYIFISSASVYEKPAKNIPIIEENIIKNSTWDYAINKIACEKIFIDAYNKINFPVTIIRPTHTYDTIIPVSIGNGDWTIPNRIIQRKPVIMHDDGKNLWTLTHSKDFSDATMHLVGNKNALGESFHITSDEILTWNEIMYALSNGLGYGKPNLVYVSSNEIAKKYPYIAPSLLNEKRWDGVYNNNKIKIISNGWSAKVKFLEGIKETIEWFLKNKELMVIDEKLDLMMDEYS